MDTTTKKRFTVGCLENGQTAIFAEGRGLVCVLNSGSQATRDADAQLICNAVNDAPALLAEVERLRAALEGLFEHCAMPHKHWGEGSNQKQATGAIAEAKAALAGEE